MIQMIQMIQMIHRTFFKLIEQINDISSFLFGCGPTGCSLGPQPLL